MIEIGSSTFRNFLFGIILFKYYSDQVFRRHIPDNKGGVSFNSAMIKYVEGILTGERLQLKLFNVVSISLLCLGVLSSIVRVALGTSS